MTAKFLAGGLLVWFALLALVVLGRALRGDIPFRGALAHDPRRVKTQVDPERVLMLAVFPAVLVMYVTTALGQGLILVDGRPSLPDVSQYLVSLLTGSNGLYLAGKISRGG